MPQRFSLCFLMFIVLAHANGLRIAAQESPGTYSEIVLRDQPVGYWDLSVPKSAKSIPSKAGAELPAKLFGKVVMAQQGPRPKAYPLFDQNNMAGDFPGGKDCLQVNDPGEKSPLDFDTGDAITLEAWVFPRAIGNNQYVSVISKGRTGNAGFEKENLNYALRLQGVNQVALVNFLFRSRNVDGELAIEEKPNAAPKFHRWTSSIGFPVESGWHHIVVTYSFGTLGSLRAYIDGQAVDRKSVV